MSVSLPGLIGLVIGLYLGWLDWKIVCGSLQAVIRRKREAGVTGPMFVEQAEPVLRKLLFFVLMIGFPFIGYNAGMML